jgi:hypothetical protein
MFTGLRKKTKNGQTVIEDSEENSIQKLHFNATSISLMSIGWFMMKKMMVIMTVNIH